MFSELSFILEPLRLSFAICWELLALSVAVVLLRLLRLAAILWRNHTLFSAIYLWPLPFHLLLFCLLFNRSNRIRLPTYIVGAKATTQRGTIRSDSKSKDAYCRAWHSPLNTYWKEATDSGLLFFLSNAQDGKYTNTLGISHVDTQAYELAFLSFSLSITNSIICHQQAESCQVSFLAPKHVSHLDNFHFFLICPLFQVLCWPLLFTFDNSEEGHLDFFLFSQFSEASKMYLFSPRIKMQLSNNEQTFIALIVNNWAPYSNHDTNKGEMHSSRVVIFFMPCADSPLLCLLKLFPSKT